MARDLVGHIDRTFRTDRGRGARALVGQSMGAYGALRIAAARPDVFGTAVAVSAPNLVNPNPLGAAALEAALAMASPDSVLTGSPLPAVMWSKAAAFSADPSAQPFFAALPIVRDGNGTRPRPWAAAAWDRNTIAGLLREPSRREALRQVAVRLDIGEADPLLGETLSLSDSLVARDIPHAVARFDDGHVQGVRRHFTDSVLPFVSRRFAEPSTPDATRQW